MISQTKELLINNGQHLKEISNFIQKLSCTLFFQLNNFIEEYLCQHQKRHQRKYPYKGGLGKLITYQKAKNTCTEQNGNDYTHS